MKIIWRGNIKNTESFSKNYIPKNAVEIKEPKNKIVLFTPTIIILLYIFLLMSYKRNFIQDFVLDIPGILLGFIIVIPLY